MLNDPQSSYAHGFFSGVVAGPMVMPSEFLPRFVSGKAGVSALKADTGLVLRRFNAVADLLQRHPKEFIDALVAFGRADNRGDVLADWFRGFRDAMELRRDEWRSLEDDPATSELLAPVSTIGEILENSEQRDTLENEAVRESLGRVLGTMTVRVAEVFRKRLAAQMQRLKGAPQMHRTVRREQPRVSRNAPCPCGSGKSTSVAAAPRFARFPIRAKSATAPARSGRGRSVRGGQG